ncbi:MAG TPA: efflux RND transporter permease subunit [Chthonomonadaceae bacterium]|nr:efflux RND transporter permease subunit [Chthonomonadaceae bacterium]
MQWLANICVRRPVFATVIILILVVVGAFGYTRLGVDLFPKVDFPVVTVTVREDGASPEEIETDVVDKIEEAVNTVSGIDQLTSTSYEGVGQVIVTFQLEKDINIAQQEVQGRVNQALPNLPVDIKPPVVDKVDPDAAPILDIALSSPGSIRDTTEFADKVLRRQIESIGGVGQVTIVGGRARQINIWLDPGRLRALNLTATDVQNALANQNIQVPGGQVDQGARELTLRTHGRVQTPQQFGAIIIAMRNGAPIHVSDVARVEDGMEEAKTVAEMGGKPTVLLSIRKQSGQNTVETVNAVKARLSEIQKILPPGARLVIGRDQSRYIIASTNAVKEHLLLGSILAALVVLLFLWNLRTTIIAGIAIPASIISTFALMYIMGFTLNSLTLLALTLSVGIVIDDAIVVLENIYRFIEEKRMNPFEASIAATREIGLAVLATTLSLITVFLPVAFMTGIVGRFMNSFGLTMAFAIAVSLIVSFTLTPMLSSRWIKPPRPTTEEGPETPEGMPIGLPKEAAGRAEAADTSAHASSKQTGFFKPIDAVYTALLKFSMRHRWVIVLASLGALFSMGPMGQAVNKNFLPDDDQSEFQITVRAAEGTSLAATQALARRIANDTSHLPGVSYTLLTIGNNAQQTPNLASIYVKMIDVEKRPTLSQQDVMQMARNTILPKYGNLRGSVGPVPAFSTGSQATINYFIAGPDLNKLSSYSDTIMAQLKKVPGVVDADTSLITGVPELGVNIDRQRAADLGVSVADIANALRIMVGGAKVTDYYENGEQYEVHLRAELPYRSDPSVISQMNVPSVTQGSVPLDSFVTFANGTGPAQINRLDRKRNLVVSCNVLPGFSQQAIQSKLGQMIADLRLPPGYTSGPVGTSRELVRSFVAFLTAFALAIIFMYLVLAAQFESWVHPITILMALPLTVPFALFSILIFNQSLNIFTMLGMLVLFGVVKKNGILQVDHTNQLRAHGMKRYDAIIQANRDRLRPILMTTMAFVAGMIPLVISRGTGAATNQGIGFTVIGGQTLSLLLTLLATPVFYSIFDDIVTTSLWGRMRNSFGRIGRVFRRRS